MSSLSSPLRTASHPSCRLTIYSFLSVVSVSLTTTNCLRRVLPGQGSLLLAKVTQNHRSSLRSHVNSSAQLERVNSPLRGSNNTRFVIISLTLTVHYAENGSNIKHRGVWVMLSPAQHI